jgi:hypothetical protein
MRKGVRICREEEERWSSQSREAQIMSCIQHPQRRPFSSPTTQHSRLPTSREEPRQLSTTHCVAVQVYQDTQIYSVDPSSHHGRLSTNSRQDWNAGSREDPDIDLKFAPLTPSGYKHIPRSLGSVSRVSHPTEDWHAFIDFERLQAPFQAWHDHFSVLMFCFDLPPEQPSAWQQVFSSYTKMSGVIPKFQLYFASF